MVDIIQSLVVGEESQEWHLIMHRSILNTIDLYVFMDIIICYREL